ncbi:alpha-L-fucosidase [Paenibacillus glycanilyticus]|uniref:alpha-L-fucosidase n=1 Tax=Paenibacillus glycanilyticus TaxID=126569 RepID=A0ABQ6GBV6_9BACL|nr:alpha-L-fucosidase [Paenibacillus glycanilyticus]GLX68439.1 alpha-L-fucosidase [Paenibacillus glycanilyticus]
MKQHNTVEASRERTRWFQRDRFGMFIHWGLYSIPSRHEWVRSHEKMTVDQYQVYYDEFNPVDYKPKEWARLAREAGMKYAVLTSKHHDGFCLFDSKLTEYKSTNTLAGRDLVAEFVEAFRAEGLKVGLYYSLIDWHHEDYPAYGDRYHPMRDNEEYRRDPQNFHRYVDYMHGQVRELLQNYGKLDLMWFDFSYDDMKGEKWRASELMEMIRSIQPHIIMDNRLEANGEELGSIFTKEPTSYAGDFASPEQIIPPEGVVDTDGIPIPWEACITLNNNWGYTSADHLYKSARTVIRKLVECVSKNGNMLLNIGPDARGNIPKATLDILTEVGEWLNLNAESIYGCGQSEFPKPDWGRFTQNGNQLYAHIYEESIGPIHMPGLKGRVKKARMLADASEVFLSNPWNTAMFPNDAFISLARPEHFSFPLPDDRVTVVKFELI